MPSRFSQKFSSRQHRFPAVILGSGLVATGRRLQGRRSLVGLSPVARVQIAAHYRWQVPALQMRV